MSATTKCEIDRLPHELLSAIFLFVAHPDTDEDALLHHHRGSGKSAMAASLPSLKLDKQPCTLTQVGKKWRRIALTTPSLWAMFQLQVTDSRGSSPSPSYDSQVAILRKWLELSRNAPLTFCFGTPFTDTPIPPEILSHAPRWRVL